MGVLSKLDEILLNPQIRTHSGTVPGIFRNTSVENQDSNEDRSEDDPHPEVGPSVYQSRHSNDSDPDEPPHMVAGVQQEIRYRPFMVTGVQKEIRYRPHLVTRVQEETSFCSPGTSSGKQKNTRSTSQPQFRSENTPATIEADQILLTLQQLANKGNSAEFNNNFYRILKLPETLTTTKPTFDGKSEKFELFEDLFQTSLKIHNQPTDED